MMKFFGWCLAAWLVTLVVGCVACVPAAMAAGRGGLAVFFLAAAGGCGVALGNVIGELRAA